jgi:hypothetical protein
MCGGWGVPEDDESSPDDSGCGKKKTVGEKVIGPSFDKGRRGFTMAAMSSPILMSLFSKPAWSQVACSISGLTSGNVSKPGGVPGPCSSDGMGCTPGIWKTHPAGWFINTPYSPGSCKSYAGGSGNCKEWNTGTGDKFSTVFGFSPPGDNANATLMDIVSMEEKFGGDGVNHAMAAHWVAALLNASAAPLAYGSTAQQVINIVYTVAHGDGLVNGVTITKADLHATLVQMNQRNCFMNSFGFCADGYVSENGECIPSCEGGKSWDVNTKACIADDDNGWGVDYCTVQDAIDGADWCSTTSTT